MDRDTHRGVPCRTEGGVSMKRTTTTTPAPVAALDINHARNRAEIMQRMEFNALTRGNGCGVLNDTQLSAWMEGANITRHYDDFGAFEILFGFDRDGQDFVIAKSKAPAGLHFALIAQDLKDRTQ